MNATTPPFFCASASTCWHSVVLPEDSGPKISVIRPRGIPPTPSARSSAIDPVGIASTCCFSEVPSFMIEPRPNCFSIERMAASTALVRSVFARSTARSGVALIAPLRSAAFCCPVPVIVIPGLLRRLRPRAGASELLLVLLFGRFPPGLPLRLDDLYGLRGRVHQGFELGLARGSLRLLLAFAAGGNSACHGFSFLHMAPPSLGDVASLRLHPPFAAACGRGVPACVSRLWSSGESNRASRPRTSRTSSGNLPAATADRIPAMK